MQFTSWVNATTPAQLVRVFVTRSADDNNTLLVDGDEDVDEDDPGDVRGAHDEGASARGKDDSRVNDDIDSLYNDLHDEIIDALVTFDGAAVVTAVEVAAVVELLTFKVLYARERETTSISGGARRGRQEEKEERKKTRVSMVCSLEKEKGDNK